MRRSSVPPLIAAAALLLAACSPGQSAGPPEGTSSPGAAAVSAPSPSQAEAAASDDPSQDSSAAAADFYCEAADDGYVAVTDLLDATDRKSAETGIDDGRGDVAAMNAAGADMLAAAQRVEEDWGAAQTRVDSEPWNDADAAVSTDAAAEAFTLYFAYLDGFAIPEARIAAESSSMEEYSVATAALLTSPGMTDTATKGAAAIGTILEYTLARCGDLPTT